MDTDSSNSKVILLFHYKLPDDMGEAAVYLNHGRR